MGFCKLCLSIPIWIFVLVFLDANCDTTFPDWITPISLAIMLAGWISYSAD